MSNNQQAETLPDPTSGDVPLNMSPAPLSPQDVEDKGLVHHFEAPEGQGILETLETGQPTNFHDKAARAAIKQHHIIPKTGTDTETGKWEKIFFMIFRMSVGGAAIQTYGASRNQQFLNAHFTSGHLTFAGRTLTVNAYLLDLNGILFACQLVCLLLIGPYVDYGSWRPYLLIFFEALVYICCFALAALSGPDQWKAANALWFLGTLSLNLANTFYYATFPSLVKNFAHIRESERAVVEGRKSAEEHTKLDSLERAKFYNYCIVTASSINLLLLAIAIGIAAGIGIKTTAEIQTGIRYLIVYFAILEVFFVTPYLYLFAKNKRPGQQLPDRTPFYLAGPKQAWQALRYAWDLKQFLIYLVSYFLIQEAFGAAGNIGGILQNEVIHYNTIELSGLTALDFFTGATGTLFVSVIQQRWKLNSKHVLLYGAAMTLVSELWGGIGAFTHVIGYHHAWEFWLLNAWNFQSAAWNSYYVILLSELVPQPKMYMFFCLLNVIGKTSGFTGPFISSAIITAANGNTNMAYWFLFGMGCLGFIVLCFVDVEKAKIDVARFLEREARMLYSEQQRVEGKVIDREEL